MPLLLGYWRRSNTLFKDFTFLFPSTFSPIGRHPMNSVLISLTLCLPLAVSLSLSLSACLCLVHLRFLRSWDSEGDFILHWAMKALYKYIATASALIASAILIWLFCCASQHMEERGRSKGREKKRREFTGVLEREKDWGRK